MALIAAGRARRLIVAVLALGAPVFAGCARLLGATSLKDRALQPTTFHEIPVGDGRRGFLLHRPPQLGTKPLPVLVILHGSSANANTVESESHLDRVADSVGALAVYPNGTGGIPYFRLFWNFLDCCGSGHRGPDESAMIRAIVDTLSGHFAIDRSRVGVVGFSDAATLAYQVACDDADVVSAIGVISGELATSCVPPAPVSTIVFHGTADRNIRYGRTFEGVAQWATRMRCTQLRVDTAGTIARADYTSCPGGAEVTLYTILGGKHAWPGGKPSWFLAPAPSRAVDASEVFAAFVLSHPRSAR